MASSVLRYSCPFHAAAVIPGTVCCYSEQACHLPLSLPCPCTTPAAQRDLNWTLRGQGGLPSEQPSSGCHKQGAQNPAQQGNARYHKDRWEYLHGVPTITAIWDCRVAHQPVCGKHPQAELISTCLSSCGIIFFFSASAPPHVFLSTTCCITEANSEQLQSAGQQHLQG